MATLNDLSVGDRWGYRSHESDVLTEVEIRSINSVKPIRVEVEFVALPEGPVMTVPLSHLKTPWAKRGEFLQWETRWRASKIAQPATKLRAIRVVIDLYLDPAVDADRLVDRSDSSLAQ